MTDREQQLARALGELYGAALEVAVVTPPDKMTREFETFLRTVDAKCKALDVKPWPVKFVEPKT